MNGISSKSFHNIGAALMRSSELLKSSTGSLSKSNNSLSKSNNDLSVSIINKDIQPNDLLEQDISIGINTNLIDDFSYSSDDENKLDYLMINDKNIVYIDDLTLKQYDIQLILNDEKYIQLKIIDLSNFNYYIKNIDSSYLDDKSYISSINILHSLLYDAITKKHKNVVKIEFKIVNNKICSFNLIYNTSYNKYILLFELSFEEVKESVKKDLIIHYLIHNNLQLTQKVNELEHRLLKVELL